MENEIMNNTEKENDDIIVMDIDEVGTEEGSKLGTGASVLIGAGLVAGVAVVILIGEAVKKVWKKFKDKKEAEKAEAESKTDDENNNDSEG